MADVDQLLKQYIEEHRAGGEADPLAYLEQVEGTDRKELAALIDAYLIRSPGQPWDEQAYRGSPAERLVESLHESLAGESGSWPVLLPQLRNKARIKREQLVNRLATALGVAGREEKVAYYYNQMEHGRLSPGGVSDRVLEALAGIVDTTTDVLRRAGQAVSSQQADAEAVFARVAPRRRPSTGPRAAKRRRQRLPMPARPSTPSGTRSTSCSSAAESGSLSAPRHSEHEHAATRPSARVSLRSAGA